MTGSDQIGILGHQGRDASRLPRPVPVAMQCWPGDARPLVSISCITYNHEAFIGDCLDGFLAQETDFPVEILIHDDASTDGTASVIREYETRYPQVIKPIYQSRNQFSQGRKPGIDFNFPRTKGRYIATCEGDDYWTDPRKLQVQTDFLERNPDFVICYHDAAMIDEAGNIITGSKLRDRFKRDYSADELKKGAKILTLTKCFRNVPVVYPEEFYKVLNGDTFQTILLGQFGKGKYLGNITPAVYRRHRGSIWSSLDRHSQSLQRLNSRLYMYQYHYRESGKDFATEFLTAAVVPALAKVLGPKNLAALATRRKGPIDDQTPDATEDSSARSVLSRLRSPVNMLRRFLGRQGAKAP